MGRLVASLVRNQARNIHWTGVALFLLTLAAGAGSIIDIYRHAWSNAWTHLDNLSTVLEAQAARSMQVIDIRLLDVQARISEQAIRTEAELRARFAMAEDKAFLGILTQTLLMRSAIAVFDDAGALISRSHANIGSNEIAERNIVRWLRDNSDGGLVIGDPVIDGPTGRPCMTMGRRLTSRTGEPLGFAVATVDFAAMRELYQNIAGGRSISISLLRPDGTVLIRYPALTGPTHRIPPGADWFGRVQDGGGTFRGRESLSGRATLLSVRPMQQYPLVVEVVQDQAEILGQWRREAAEIGCAVSAVGVVLIVLFVAIGRAVKAQQDYNQVLSRQAAALAASEERLDRAQEIAGLGSWEHEIASNRCVWSRNLQRIWGSDRAALCNLAHFEQSLVPADRPKWQLWYADLRAGRCRDPIDVGIIRPHGGIRTLALHCAPVPDADGVFRRLTGTVRDVTEVRKLEAELAQAQKMEAIGRLVGGFAHDSNNVLSVIIGNLDLLQPLVEENAAANELCNEALDGALRCANLIKRLLAFARRQPLHPAPAEVNAVVLDIGPLLRRTLGPAIELQLDLAPDVWPVMIDAVQLQAAIVNLAANARDAMPAGGLLRITTSNLSVAHGTGWQHPDIAPGTYTAITVRDTGSGIAPDVLDRIFEPFFTTKTASAGTGLGLSMVFGFVKQSGGHVSVLSEPGVGACFRIYLPRIGAPAPYAAAPVTPYVMPSSSAPADSCLLGSPD